MRSTFLLVLLGCFLQNALQAQSKFVQVRQQQFYLDGKPYYYTGANYWYGSLLALEKDPVKGIRRLRKELDFLSAHGITNLRVIAGAEGSGWVAGVQRVGPPLQPRQGIFDASVLRGLDILLNEMAKCQMKAVIFLSNNWEWSGGFLQYLRWNNKISEDVFRQKMEWENMRDIISRFYQCKPCKQDYLAQVRYLLEHQNTINGKKYINDPAIMAWEIANEPRPMRPAVNEDYRQWIGGVAAFIHSKDKNHLVTTGHEGEIGTQSMELYQQVHAIPSIDYLTIHIWPKNWQWYSDTSIAKGYTAIEANSTAYIDKHILIATKLKKPLVIEEFGLPRDRQAYDTASPTTYRDRYFQLILDKADQSRQANGPIGGINFWAFGGFANRTNKDPHWKKGDPYMGDPPMEEQGLNSVFPGDHSTWELIRSYSRKK